MSKKILVVTGDAGESYETLYAYHRFLEAGYEPVIAAPSKRWLNLVIHDFEPGWDTYIERPGYKMESQLTFEEVVVGDYEAILIIGGRAPEYLRNNARLLSIVKDFHAAGKWVLAICHGIQVLISAGLAKGNCLTAYEHIRYEIEAGGGTYSTEQAVRDGRIITGQTWQSHPEFYREVFACLGAAQESERVAASFAD
ncbi:MAG: DJ-1/PfpI family protein [Pyrinomonadaceae bacterium]|nr:DJ-1/PfpI family protein [Pyrinomonadaceae bacterium]MBA3714600.1 DJ-1/PfpI family protein [Pyrinomonadaceae bacterium]